MDATLQTSVVIVGAQATPWMRVVAVRMKVAGCDGLSSGIRALE
jgi:hypothetical protein